ncbi:MAG: flagellar filament capping protein FliD [Desulfobacterales bacterium]|nr:flagellar filament capping protein FliD [Desulfobacterales bacterium]
MATGSVSTLGIGSTLDLQGIIDGLKEADEATITQKENEITELKATQDEFNVINAKLLAMKSSARNLSLGSNWLVRTSSVSSDNISATVADGTQTGNYTVEVDRLASQSSFISSGFEESSSSVHIPTTQKSANGFDATTDTFLAEDDTMVITYGTGDDAKTISLTGAAGGYTLDDIVNEINTHTDNDDGSGGTYVTASTYQDSDNKYHIQITATSGGTGADNKVKVTEPPDTTGFAADDATFSYRLGDNTAISLSITEDTSLTDLVTQINEDENNPGVTASLVNTGIGTSPYKLVLTSDDSGEDNRIAITTNLTDLPLTEQNGSGYIMESESTIDPSAYIVITQAKGNTDFVFQEDTGSGYSSDITATIADGAYNDGDELAAAVEKAMEDASAASGSSIDYTVAWNSSSSKLEISEAGTLTNLNIKWSDAGSTAATDLGFTNDLAITPSASSLNAAVKVDGVNYQRQTNSSLTDLITGITLTLSDTGSSTITVGQETESLEEDITALVTVLNEIVSEIDSNDDYDEDTDTWGSLAKSSSIQTLESTLLSNLGLTIDTGSSISSLYDLGFEVDDSGNITLDADALSSALSTNFDDLKTFMLGTDDVDGLAETLNDYLLELTMGSGYIDSETSGIDDKIEALEDSIEKQQEVIDSKYETMTETFVQLDSYMRQMESMSNYVSEMFSANKSSDE